jgi:hypothetical protein
LRGGHGRHRGTGAICGANNGVVESKNGNDIATSRPSRRTRADAHAHGLVPVENAPAPARFAPAGATGVRAGHLARHRRPIAPVSVGKPMPAGPRAAAQAAPVEPPNAALPVVLRARSSAVESR